MTDHEAGSMRLWRELVDLELWAVSQPPATHGEAAMLYSRGLTPMDAARRLIELRAGQLGVGLAPYRSGTF
jgi:hypothetical protein